MTGIGARFLPGRGFVVSLAMIVAGATGAQAASAGGHGYFNPRAIYNCTAVVPTGLEYIDSYQFEAHNRYAVGYQHNNRLTGHVQSGRYALRGNKIVGLSGPLKLHHESFLIQRSDLALLISGRLSGVGCRRPQPPATTTPTPTPTSTPTIPTGYYSCKHTTQTGAAYYSTYTTDIELHRDWTYQAVGAVSDSTADHWTQQGSTLTFTSGPMSHDRATWYPNGVPMPHGGTTVPATYTLVIYDTVREGATPPSAEYSTTDGPGGAASTPMSFTYCNLETPGA